MLSKRFFIPAGRAPARSVRGSTRLRTHVKHVKNFSLGLPVGAVVSSGHKSPGVPLSSEWNGDKLEEHIWDVVLEQGIESREEYRYHISKWSEEVDLPFPYTIKPEDFVRTIQEWIEMLAREYEGILPSATILFRSRAVSYSSLDCEPATTPFKAPSYVELMLL